MMISPVEVAFGCELCHSCFGKVFFFFTAESAFNLQERYRAAMVLSGTGDALGYYNGRWEFCSSGLTIFNEAEEMGGVENIQVKRELP